MTEYSVPGYKSFFRNRLNKKGVVVICYIKNMKKKTRTNYIELEINKRNKLTIDIVYKPPKQQAADEAALYEEIHAMAHNKQSVITGDFNYPKINWSTVNGDQEGNRLLDMTQIITLLIRENNILDLALVTDPDFVRDGRVGEIVWL